MDIGDFTGGQYFLLNILSIHNTYKLLNILSNTITINNKENKRNWFYSTKSNLVRKNLLSYLGMSHHIFIADFNLSLYEVKIDYVNKNLCMGD
jgi:hypothetical protein